MDSGEVPKARFYDYSIEKGVNPLWKFLAILAIGVIMGGAPNYVELIYSQHTQVTLADVDHEVTAQEAATVQRIADMQKQLDSMSQKLDIMIERGADHEDRSHQ